jgi:cytochrome b561
MTVAMERSDYSLFAKLLHWSIAAMVVFIIPAGIVMLNIGRGDLQNQLFDLHRSFGILVLTLMMIRVGYRLTFGAPAAAAVLTPLQYQLSRAAHLGMYVLLIATPLIGWIGTSAYPATVNVFGLFAMPHLVGPDRALSETLLAIHGYMGIALGVIALIHIGAALYHGFIRRDGVLSRMLA